MNKAFVSEPEPAEPRCPEPKGCDGYGIAVTPQTLRAQVDAKLLEQLSDKVYYCPTPRCPVGYFDNWGTTISAEAVRVQAYPKEPDAPICTCFGVSAEDIRSDAEKGSRERIKALLKKAESKEARCKTSSPTGESCVTEVRKLFLQHFRG
ncbi:MAG: hypothetical protein RL885_26285 [Planctomycetota bacterium]